MLGMRVDCGVQIEGKDLILVPTTKAHLGKCLEMINDPEISRFLTSRFAFSEEQETEWLRKKTEDPHSVVWSIQLGEEHIGQTGIDDINQVERTAVTGIVIEKKFWHKGIATAVMRARAEYAKKYLNLVALFTEICIENEYSWKAATTAGYEEYGRQPFGMFSNGQYYEVWLGCLDLTK